MTVNDLITTLRNQFDEDDEITSMSISISTGSSRTKLSFSARELKRLTALREASDG